MRLKVISFVAAAVALAGCQTTGWDLAEGQVNRAENTSVAVEWGDGKRYYCDNSVSPAIEATGAPVEGVAQVRAWFVDLDYLPYPHHGAIFAASDVLSKDGRLDIPQDSIANAPGNSYQAPCSKVGPHRYQFTLYFLDAKGELLGKKVAPPSPRI